MGEYIQHKGSHQKLGTCEDLFNIRFQDYLKEFKAEKFKQVTRSDTPSNYAANDSGYRFRFPFPWEDETDIWKDDAFETLDIDISNSDDLLEMANYDWDGNKITTIQITSQKHQDNILYTVVRLGERGLFRLGTEEAEKLAEYLNTLGANDLDKACYVAVSNRILMGYLGSFEIKPLPIKLQKPSVIEVEEVIEEDELIDFAKDLDYQRIVWAYNNLSWSPEKRADSLIHTYNQNLNWAKQQIELIEGATDEDFEWYKAKYTKLFWNFVYSLYNCASSAITGPSKFPVEKNRKRMEWSHNHQQKWDSFTNYGIKQIKRKHKKKKTIGELIAEASDKLLKEKTNHWRMKEANKIIRKKGQSDDDKVELLVNYIGFDYDVAKGLLKGGYEQFKLTNCRSRIKNTEKRLHDLITKSIAEDKEESYEGFELVENYEADRIQFLFEDIPSEEIRTLLKKNGFRWSRKNKAWQRKITRNAKSVTRQLLPQIIEMVDVTN